MRCPGLAFSIRNSCEAPCVNRGDRIVGLLNLLFGKKAKSAPAAGPANGLAAAPAPVRPAPPSPESRPAAPTSEAENVRRWRESGQAQAWIEVHKGQWNHDDWLKLLDTLKRSAFWPVKPDD